jgi:hypothetical protein
MCNWATTPRVSKKFLKGITIDPDLPDNCYQLARGPQAMAGLRKL